MMRAARNVLPNPGPPWIQKIFEAFSAESQSLNCCRPKIHSHVPSVWCLIASSYSSLVETNPSQSRTSRRACSAYVLVTVAGKMGPITLAIKTGSLKNIPNCITNVSVIVVLGAGKFV